MNKKRFFLIIGIFLVGLFTGVYIWKISYKPKVYDCFLFFNEFEALDIRLHELSDKVEKFILVESTKGFSNKDKPLYFQENKERYVKFLDKIVHVVVDQFPEFPPVKGTDYWDIEFFQRNKIIEGLKQCHPNKRDIVIISDVDEIVRNSKIDQIVDLIDKKDNDIVFGDFSMYRFFLNRKLSSIWSISVATSWDNLWNYIKKPQAFRDLSGFSKGHASNGFYVLDAVKKRSPSKKWSFVKIDDIGWHFTSLGGFTKFLQKIQNYSHLTAACEYNKNLENIKKEIGSCDCCEVTDQFPRYVITNLKKPEIKSLIDHNETIFH